MVKIGGVSWGFFGMGVAIVAKVCNWHCITRGGWSWQSPGSVSFWSDHKLIRELIFSADFKTVTESFNILEWWFKYILSGFFLTDVLALSIN